MGRGYPQYIHLTRYPSIYKLFNDIFIGVLGLEDVQLLLGGGVALRRKCQCGPVNEGKDGSFGGMKVTYVKSTVFCCMAVIGAPGIIDINITLLVHKSWLV